MKRDDVETASYIIQCARNFRCPVNDYILPGLPIQFSLDKFNHTKITDSGTEVSDDTAMVAWQNRKAHQGINKLL